jgi:hypothetical protein
MNRVAMADGEAGSDAGISEISLWHFDKLPATRNDKSRHLFTEVAPGIPKHGRFGPESLQSVCP